MAAFDDLVGRAGAAQATGDAGQAELLLGQALRTWRGPVLADGAAWVRQHPAVVALGQRRLAATLAYADVALAAGRDEALYPRCAHVAPDEPLHEGLHARLMLALAGAGEQAAALQTFLADPGPPRRRARHRTRAGAGRGPPAGAPPRPRTRTNNGTRPAGRPGTGNAGRPDIGKADRPGKVDRKLPGSASSSPSPPPCPTAGTSTFSSAG